MLDAFCAIAERLSGCFIFFAERSPYLFILAFVGKFSEEYEI